MAKEGNPFEKPKVCLNVKVGVKRIGKASLVFYTGPVEPLKKSMKYMVG